MFHRKGREAMASVPTNIDTPAQNSAVIESRIFSSFSPPACGFCLLAGMMAKNTLGRARRLMTVPQVGTFITASIMIKVDSEILFSATMREQASSSRSLYVVHV